MSTRALKVVAAVPAPSSLPAHAQVLRGLPERSERRALHRGREAGRASAAAASTAAAGASGDPATIDRVVQGSLAAVSCAEQAHAEGYREGWQKGREEGLQSGLEEGRLRGRELGLEQGLAEGRELGAREVNRQHEAALQATAQRIERLDQWQAALPGQVRATLAARLASAEEDMVALCHLVICRLLGERAVSRDNVADAVRRAVEECHGDDAGRHAIGGLLAIQVHPADLDLLKGDASLADWLARRGVAEVPWVPDERVALGGCVVRSAQGSLDARLDTQLAVLHETLRQARRTRDAQGESSRITDGCGEAVEIVPQPMSA